MIEQEEKLVSQLLDEIGGGKYQPDTAKKYTKSLEEQFRNIPVDQLILDNYFLNLGGVLYPSHIDDIIELFEERKKRDINLALFEESIGAGKSMIASVLLWLQWYEVSSLAYPQQYYDLDPGSTIAFMTMGKTEVQARRVIFSKVWQRFQSPFNRDYFPPNPRYSREIQMPQNNTVIYAGTSSEMAALGYDLYSGVIDEANFLEVVEDSKRSEDGVYDAAESMYNAIINRMTSRFMRNGSIPGFVVMISSRKSKDSFMERKIKEAVRRQDDPSLDIFYKVKSLWEAQPRERYPSKKYFYINTETLEKVDPIIGEALYNIQKKLLYLKKINNELEVEDIGLI